jgi:hypothetical protein
MAATVATTKLATVRQYTRRADHRDITRAEAVRRGLPMPLPNRLLHGLCNLERGDGRDYLRDVTNNQPEHALAMAWP